MFKFIPTHIDSFINAEGSSTMHSLNFAYDLEFALYIRHSVCSSAFMGSTNLRLCRTIVFNTKKKKIPGQFQDSGGIGRGDYFLPYKLIKRSFECGTTFTKQVLNTGGGHQASRGSLISSKDGRKYKR